MHIPISSVIVQNPPDLLPTRSIWPLSICPGCRCHSQPLPGVSRKQRYNILDFPRESRVPRKALPSFGNLPPRGTPFPSGDFLCQQECCSPLLENQSQRDCVPLDTLVFVACVYTNQQSLVYFAISKNARIPQISPIQG